MKKLRNVNTRKLSSKKTEEALKESEEFNASLLESAPNPINVVNPDGSLRYVNPAMETLTGYSMEELIDKKPPFPWWHESGLREIAEGFKKSMEGGVVKREILMRRRNGEPFWVEITSTNVYSGGEHKYHIANWVDITERKRAEAALKHREEQFRIILDNISDSVAIIDADLKMRYISPSGEKLLGYKADEVAGRNAFDYVHPDDIPNLAEIYKQGIKIPGFTKQLEYRLRHKDGSWRNVEVVAQNLLNNPEVAGIVLTYRDITERNKVEELLRHAAEEWRTTFDSIPDMISIHDKDFRLVRVNRAFANAFKMNPQDLIGKHCYELMHGSDNPLPFCPHRQTLETRKSVTAELFEPHLGMYLDISTSPILNGRGEVSGSVHVARDITERKRMQEQLILTDRLASVGELAAGIAHELNNPLTSIIGFSQLLMERQVPVDIEEDLKLIHREAQRTAGIVKGLLTFARKHPPTKQLVNVNKIIHDVLELRRYEQKVNNIEVNSQLADLPEIMADYFQLQQVFLNIVINAEHFMLEANGRGKLNITTERLGDMVRITFVDNGLGMTEETLKHIFTPFFTTKPVGKGTGLGLSICHGIVTGHGGRIYAESRLGEGATFYVELPVGIVSREYNGARHGRD